MRFCHAACAWHALQSAEAANEALPCVLILVAGSSPAVSLTRSARRSVFHPANSP